MNTLNKVFKVESREGELSGFVVAAAADFEVVFHEGGGLEFRVFYRRNTAIFPGSQRVLARKRRT